MILSGPNACFGSTNEARILEAFLHSLLRFAGRGLLGFQEISINQCVIGRVRNSLDAHVVAVVEAQPQTRQSKEKKRQKQVCSFK